MIIRRWPRGALLRGFFRFDDRPVRVKLRYTGDLRPPQVTGTIELSTSTRWPSTQCYCRTCRDARAIASIAL